MNLLTLDNGFKIAFSQNPTVHSVAISLYIACGSCYEQGENLGAAHFLEHMLFKGTKVHTNRELSEKMDMLGGQFNAYTTKEYTCYFCNVTTYDFEDSLNLILEMVTLPKLDSLELETERGVILEEINMYEDSAEDCAADKTSEIIFKNCGLKNAILGTRQSVSDISRDLLFEHHKKYYVPERMVLSICGNFDEDLALNLVQKYIAPQKNTNFLLKPESAEFFGGIGLIKKDFEQSQIMIASKGFALGDERRFAAAAFSAIVGGNSSSRLNMHIREKLGLAYSIYSYPVAFRPLGAFLICGGTAHKNHIKVIEETLKIANSVSGSIKPDELERVKLQYRASTVLGSESVSAISSRMGREILFFGKYTDIDTVIEKINALTLKDVENAGNQLWQKDRLALTVVGKPESEKTYKNLGF